MQTKLDVMLWLDKNNIPIIDKIQNIEKINKGFVNQIYKITLNDNQVLKLRIANENKFINRKLEYIIEANLNNGDFLYYNKNTGDYLRYWIDGKHPSKNDFIEKWSHINNTLNFIHNIKPYKTYITYPEYYDLNLVDEKIEKYFNDYKKIVDLFYFNDFVVSHNDFSSSNILITNSNLKVFDFEWASWNHKLWDICNLIKDLNLNYDEILIIDEIENNIKQYVQIIFCVHMYTYFWTKRVPETRKIKKYRKEVLRRIKYWYKQLELNNESNTK